MKILVKENNKPKIYVQIQDVAYLKSIGTTIPETIDKKVYPDGVNAVSTNIFDYVGFNDEDEINFLNSQKVINDSKKFNDLSVKEIELKADKIINLLNKVTNIYGNLKKDDPKKVSMLNVKKYLLYAFTTVSYVYSLKKKEIKPSIVSSDLDYIKHSARTKNINKNK